MGKWLLVPLFALVTSIGCGPEQTARDAANEESDRIVAEKTRIYRQFEGTYSGTMVSVTGKDIPVRLKLQVFNIFIPDPKSNDVQEVPNLRGYFFYCYLGKGQRCKDGTWRSLASFREGQFDDAVTILVLGGAMGSPGGGGGKSGNPGGAGGGDATMVLKRLENGFEGSYDSSNISTTVKFVRMGQLD